MMEFAFNFICGILMVAISCIGLLILGDILVEKWWEIKERMRDFKDFER